MTEIENELDKELQMKYGMVSAPKTEPKRLIDDLSDSDSDLSGGPKKDKTYDK